MAIKWGNIIEGSTDSRQGKIGIDITKASESSTEFKVNVVVWFASKYSLTDTSNTYYYNAEKTSATTSKGSVSIKHTVASGSGWSSDNQTKLGSYSYTYTKSTSSAKKNYAAKITGIDNFGSSSVSSVTDYITVPALAKYTITYNANGGSGAPSSQSKYYGKTLTLSSTKPTRTGYTFQGWGLSTSDTSVDYKPGGSYTANASDTLYAIWKINTYTVTFNANGGSNAPGAQTKNYGATLTLSSSKPTRTGYTFKGWGTTTTDTSANYQPGGSYTANADEVLYAIWEINTYTVTFNANGGSNAPGAQTKNYGKTLTLSSTKPTRSGYAFKGWGTSKTATTVSYNPGGSYTANKDITLYAVWTQNYKKPRITSASVSRCTSGGTYNDEGTYAKVYFKWATDVTVSSVTIQWKLATASSYPSANKATVSASGTGATVTQIVGGGALSPESTYTIRINVTDSGGSSFAERTLNAMVLPIDVLAGGKSVAIGKPAESGSDNEGILDIGYYTRMRQTATIGPKTGYYDGKAGLYLNGDGYIHLQRETSQGYHPYIAFLLDAATAESGLIRVNSSSKNMEFKESAAYTFDKNVVVPNEPYGYYAMTTTGIASSVMFLSDNNNLVLGWDIYNSGIGTGALCGHDVYHYVSNIPEKGRYRPYYRQGDSITCNINTAGFLTQANTHVRFYVPVSKPIIGNPTVSASSVNGFILRQNTAYTHGSASGSYVKPSSYSAVLLNDGVFVQAEFTNTANSTNNDTIGILWSGKITFS